MSKHNGNGSRNYRSLAYRKWRKAVRNRDGGRCQWPGCKHKGRVYAHHIRKWEDYPSLRYDVDNGICLCYRHHKQVTGREEEYVKFFKMILRRNENAD